MKSAFGIDVGGTKISIILGKSNGQIIACRQFPTLKGRKARQSISEISDCIKTLQKEKSISSRQIAGIGVGIPGPMDSKTGIVPKSPHMTGWTGIPLGAILRKSLGWPVYLTNDANAAALGEKIFGAGKKTNDFVYMTISTGIGGGIISNGELVQGVSCMAGEIGHMKIVANGRRCKCGHLGCLEAYASGTAIANAAASALKKGAKSKMRKLLNGKHRLSARDVSAAANAGDRLALQVFEEAGNWLGVGISNILHLVNPGVIVLGGGVLLSAPPLFWNAMMKTCRQNTWPPAMKAVQIVRSRIKGSVGDLGAMALVFQKQSEKGSR